MPVVCRQRSSDPVKKEGLTNLHWFSFAVFIWPAILVGLYLPVMLYCLETKGKRKKVLI